MLAASPCPEVGEVERILVGQASSWSEECLARHLEHCSHCGDLVDQFLEREPVVAVLRSPPKAPPQTDDAVVHQLVGRLRLLRCSAAQSHDTPVSVATSALATPNEGSSAECTEEWSGLLAPPVEPDEIGRLGAYGIVRVLGSGGMGVVFAARQVHPRRLVALKMILAGPRAGGQRLARFHSETDIIARVQHPNIVPVFEVGDHEGRPYFTMEYMEGGSLAQRLAAAPFAARAAAALVEVLARAVHFAHERGFVHRDLKPANVLLTADGVPKVGDFGLAKQLAPEPDRAAGYRTETGAVLGTPSYMAPEQASGSREIGPVADVYALGAILYETLTGKPPFRAATLLETLEQVRSQEPVAPSRLQPLLPRDLETICLKCLEKDPARRYAGAALLADDLSCFLQGKPVQARPASRWERLRKWVRRQPTLAALLAVTGLSLLAALTGVIAHNARLQAEVSRAEKGETEAHKQHERALANYQKARETVNRMLGRIKDKQLADVPRLKELDKQLREDALEFYQAIFPGSEDPDPTVRYDVAVAYLEAATIEFHLGRWQQCEQNVQQARALLESLAGSHADKDEYRSLLLRCYTHLAHLSGLRRGAASLQWYQKVLALWEESASLFPDDRRWQANVAAAHNNLAGAHLANGELREAERYYEKALSIQEALAREDTRADVYASAIAATSLNLGTIYKLKGDRGQAEGMYRKSTAIFGRLLGKRPNDHDIANKAAVACNNQAALLLEEGQLRPALDLLTHAIELMEPLARREPQAHWNYPLLESRALRARAFEEQGDKARSQQDWQRMALDASAMPAESYGLEHVLALAHLGQWQEALAKVVSDGNPGTAFRRARVYAVCAQGLAQDTDIPTSERSRRAERYAADAVGILSKARDAGALKDLEQNHELRNNPDFAPLRSRTDFQELLTKLDAR